MVGAPRIESMELLYNRRISSRILSKGIGAYAHVTFANYYHSEIQASAFAEIMPYPKAHRNVETKKRKIGEAKHVKHVKPLHPRQIISHYRKLKRSRMLVLPMEYAYIINNCFNISHLGIFSLRSHYKCKQHTYAVMHTPIVYHDTFHAVVTQSIELVTRLQNISVKKVAHNTGLSLI